MPAFTTEPAVRLRMQLTDTSLAPTDLVQQCIDDAHAQVLERLAPEVDLDAPPELLVQGETLLAGSLALLALAAKDAATQKQLSIGGQRLEEGDRFSHLRHAAEDSAAEAWRLMAPYLNPPSPVTHLKSSATEPIFE